MSYLDVNNLSFKYQEKPIFEGAEMRLFEGRAYGDCWSKWFG